MVDLEKLFLENEGLIFYTFNTYIVKRLKNKKYLHDEFLLVGRVGLWKACLDFENGKYNKKKGEFSTYAVWKIRGEMTTFARENYIFYDKEVKYKTNYSLISLNTIITNGKGDTTEISDFLISSNYLDCIDTDFQALFKDMQLTRKEIEIVTLVMEGFSTKEISQMIGISRQMVCNRKNKIKDKYNKYRFIENKKLQRVI